MTKMESSPIPVLEAYRYTSDRREVSLVVWCLHCRRWHWHGAGNAPGAGDGHRVAHCINPKSPYNQGGYVLREVAPITAPVMKRLTADHQRRARLQGVPDPLPAYLAWYTHAPRKLM